MSNIIFHGPVNDKDCYRIVRKLAKKWGGKFSYNSFWVHRRKRWHSPDTVGKAAYCVRQLPQNAQKRKGSRAEFAALVREARTVRDGGLKVRVWW